MSTKKGIATGSRKPKPAKPKAEPDKAFVLNIGVPTPTASIIDLAEKGPVHIIRSIHGAGLLIHHEAGPDAIILQSLTSGLGLTLTRDAARILGLHLSAWADGAQFWIAT